MAAEAGFVSAASAISGVVETAGRTSLHALPRVSWDGRLRSLRNMRVMLSGSTFPRSRRASPVGNGDIEREVQPGAAFAHWP
jgi:hypothetical protein